MKKFLLWVCAFLLIAGTGYSATIYSQNFDSTSTSAGVYTWTRSSTTYVIRTTTYKVGVASMRLAYGKYAYKTVNTTGFSGIKVAFKLAAYSMESGEKVYFQYRTSSSASWVTIGTVADGADTGAFKSFSVTLPAAANNNPNLQIKVAVSCNSTSDYGYLDDVVVTGTPCKSTRTGMGAIVYSGGTMFRVWAPNATSVAVAGSFNSYSATATPLVSEGNGYWSRDVPSVASGAKYKYVINGSLWKQDPYSRKVENSSGNSIVYATGSSLPSTITLPYFENMIIYQLHVGAFGGSSSAGIGTFAKTYAKAAYLQSLGVNMVELLPVSEFPGDNSWGYNPSDPFAPESYYGGPEGLKALVSAFHAKGIGVILDMVYNHFGPSDLDMWQFDGWSQNSKGGIYFYNDYRSSTPWGDTRPDYGRGEVRTYLKDNAVYWLTEFKVDGLRFDSTVNIRQVSGTDIPDGWSLMQYINNSVDSTKPAAITIAEDLQQNAWLTYTTGAGGAGFDSQWDAGFVHPIKTAIETSWDSDRSMSAVAAAIKVHYGDRVRQIDYVSSHDEVGNGSCRPPSAIDSSNPSSWLAKKRSTLGACVLMTSPGIPMIFMGEEFLQPGWFDNAVYNNYLTWSLTNTCSGILKMYKDLINIRKNYAALKTGNINVYHVDNNNKLVVYNVWNGTQSMVIIANFANKTWTGNYTIGWPVNKTGHCIFNGDSTGYSSNFGNYGGYTISPSSGSYDGMSYKATVNIAPYTVLIYDLY